MRFFRQFWAGRKLTDALLSGHFDDSPVAQQFALWFSEHPAREEQRQTFVQLATGLPCPSGIVAERLMHCITEVWRGQGAKFGDTLAREIDHMFTFDPPKSARSRASSSALPKTDSQIFRLDFVRSTQISRNAPNQAMQRRLVR